MSIFKKYPTTYFLNVSIHISKKRSIGPDMDNILWSNTRMNQYIDCRPFSRLFYAPAIRENLIIFLVHHFDRPKKKEAFYGAWKVP